MAWPWTKNHLMLRTGASFSLVLWIAGSLVCGSQCMVGAQTPQTSADHELHAATTPSCHASSETAEGEGAESGPCCCSQKLITGSFSKIIVSRVESTPSFQLVPLPTPTEASLVLSSTGFGRPSRLRSSVTTPVLYLGPAVRSHAPPVSFR